jgi:hypothetical protein
LPHKPQSVPPIYQPEVAADAIVFAATHRRREVWVAWPVAEAIVGEKLAPGVADHYLAANGYDSQQTDEAIEPDRRDNLYEPLPGDRGAHGTFDARSRSFSVGLFLSKYRGALLGAAAAAIAGVGALAGYRLART